MECECIHCGNEFESEPQGAHRLLCGDSTKADDVERALGGKKPHLMVTDPPYGVDYDPDWRNKRGSEKLNGKRMVGAGARSIGKVENDGRSDWSAAWALFDGDVAYVWCASLTNDIVIASLESCDINRRGLIVWNKQHISIGRSDYHWKHELCWYAVRKGKTGHWAGDRKQSSVWDIDAPNGFLQKKNGPDAHTGIHSTQKPVECMRRPIQNNSKPGDFVYDPFLGSGTSVIAAEMMNRYCIGLELSPAYCDVIAERWMAFSKGEATLDGDGRTFAQIKAARMKVPVKKEKKSAASVASAPVRKGVRERATT